MNTLELSALGIPLIEMRCPLCKSTQYVKVRNLQPHLTRCCTCKNLLMYSVVTKEKPNNVLLQLAVTGMPNSSGEGLPDAQ